MKINVFKLYNALCRAERAVKANLTANNPFGGNPIDKEEHLEALLAIREIRTEIEQSSFELKDGNDSDSPLMDIAKSVLPNLINGAFDTVFSACKETDESRPLTSPPTTEITFTGLGSEPLPTDEEVKEETPQEYPRPRKKS
jgi:hypothetical protein